MDARGPDAALSGVQDSDAARTAAHGGGHDGGDGGLGGSDCGRLEGPLAELGLYSGKRDEQIGTVSLSIDAQQNLQVRVRLSGNRRDLEKLRLFIGPDAPRSHKSGDNHDGWQKQMRRDYHWGPYAHEMCRPRSREDTFRIPLRDIKADCGADCAGAELQYMFAVYASGRSRSGGRGHDEEWEATAWTSGGRVIFPQQQWKSYDRAVLLFPACEGADDGGGGGGGGGGENQAPQADLQSDVNGGNKPLDVNFDASSSSDSDGTIADYEWDFDGDGNFNESDNNEQGARGKSKPAKVRYAATGTYNVGLRVTDDAGASSTTSKPIVVTNGGPTADLQASPLSGDKPLSVSFNASASVDADGSLVDYEWDFDGDGSFNESGDEGAARGNPTPAAVIYGAVGSYDATVRVTDDDGVTASATQQISVSNAAPTAQLSSDVSSGFKPLSVNFDASGSSDSGGGSIVNYEWDFDGDGIFSEAGDEATAEGYAIPATIVYGFVGDYPAAVRVTDDDAAQSTAAVNISVSNSPPLASLSASETWGEAPLSVNFDGSASSDPGGSIDDYEWDLDGDGTFNETGFEADSRGFPQASFTYTSIGSFHPSLRVTDDDGASDSAALEISAGGWGSPLTLDSTGSVGHHTSLAFVNGRPAIAYFDNSQDDLRFVRALDAAGDSWGAAQIVDAGGSVGAYCSLCVVSGNPAVSYYDAGAGDLRFVRALDSDGGAWGASQVLDGAAGNVGQYTSLDVINGIPAVSYYDVGATDLRYIRALDASGSSWAAGLTIDAGTNTGQYSSLALVNGRPAVSYYDVNGSNLRYIRALDALGTAWAAGVTLDSTGTTGLFTSLAVINGNPAISFQHSGSGDLRYIRAQDLDGVLWGPVQTIDSTGVTGQYTSLATVVGRPAIAYYDVTQHDLRYIRALDASGLAWGPGLTLDSLNFTGAYCSLAIINGGPAISYQDVSATDLRYVRHLP